MQNNIAKKLKVLKSQKSRSLLEALSQNPDFFSQRAAAENFQDLFITDPKHLEKAEFEEKKTFPARCVFEIQEVKTKK